MLDVTHRPCLTHWPTSVLLQEAALSQEIRLCHTAMLSSVDTLLGYATTQRMSHTLTHVCHLEKPETASE
ncbi:uncharacterized [Tachysurus ichikawai]